MLSEEVMSLLEYINGIEPSIKLTKTEDSNTELPFLDVLLRRNDDGSIITSVFRKPTNTDRYLNFDSHHPIMHKASVISTLVGRAETICLNTSHIQEEIRHIFQALENNSYPTRGIRFSVRQPWLETADNEGVRATVVLPYIRGVSRGF